MPDKSLPQLNKISDIKNTDLYHVVRNNIDYAITGENLKKAVRPYKVWSGLIQQIAPSTETSGTLYLGAKYTLTTFNAGDDFSNQELLSGTVNTSGSTFRCIVDTPTVWSNGSTVDQDGTPFVVSKNPNNEIAPFIKDFDVTFQRFGAGEYKILFAEASLKVQTFTGASSLAGRVEAFNTYDDTGVFLESYNLANSLVDDVIENLPIEIRVYY